MLPKQHIPNPWPAVYLILQEWFSINTKLYTACTILQKHFTQMVQRTTWKLPNFLVSSLMFQLGAPFIYINQPASKSDYIEHKV